MRETVTAQKAGTARIALEVNIQRQMYVVIVG